MISDLCDDVLIQIFWFLNNYSLRKSKLVNSQWKNIIETYQYKFFVPTWIETDQEVQRWPKQIDFVSPNTNKFHQFPSLGIKFFVKLKSNFICLHIETNISKTLRSFKWRVKWDDNYSIYTIYTQKCINLPTHLSTDKQIHRFVIVDIIKHNIYQIERVCVFDLTHLDNILMFNVDITFENTYSFASLLRHLPYFNQDYTKYTVFCSRFRTVINSDTVYYSYINETGKAHKNMFSFFYNPFKILKSKSQTCALHCHKFAFECSSDILNVYDLSHSSDDPILIFYKNELACCGSIDLTLDHFLILFGEWNQEYNCRTYGFYYLLVDTKRRICKKSGPYRNGSFLILNDSKVERISFNIVKVYNLEGGFEIELDSLSVIQ